jgi:hypothetical protein
MTLPNSLFSKIKMTTWEKLGTISEKTGLVGVGVGVGVGGCVGVLARVGRLVRVAVGVRVEPVGV